MKTLLTLMLLISTDLYAGLALRGANTTAGSVKPDDITATQSGDDRLLDVMAHDHLIEAIRGNNGITVGETFGSNEDIDAAASETIWDNGGLYVRPTEAQITLIASTSANDASGSTGALTLQVIGLDSNYNEVTEVIVMNGTTNVSSTTPFIAINRLVVLTGGTDPSNAGTITATQVNSNLVMRTITAGEGVSHSLLYTVPNGKEVIIKRLTVSSGKDSGGGTPKVTWNLFSRVALTNADYVIAKDLIDTSVRGSSLILETPAATPQIAGTLIELVASTTTNDTAVFARFERIAYDVTELYPGL